jgi:Mg2+ and Co2+ transporter CorA
LELARTLWSWRRVLNLQMKQNQEIEAELRRNLKSLGKKIDHVIELLKRVEKKAVNTN